MQRIRYLTYGMNKIYNGIFFNKTFIMVPNPIQILRVHFKNLKVAIQRIANSVVPPIRVHVALI